MAKNKYSIGSIPDFKSTSPKREKNQRPKSGVIQSSKSPDITCLLQSKNRNNYRPTSSRVST